LPRGSFARGNPSRCPRPPPLITLTRFAKPTTKTKKGEATMRKTVLLIAGGAFLSAATLTPIPASAFVPLLFVPVMMAKKDPNFKEVNPYAPQPAKMTHKKSKKKMRR
jgi:hypothetical protein